MLSCPRFHHSVHEFDTFDDFFVVAVFVNKVLDGVSNKILCSFLTERVHGNVVIELKDLRVKGKNTPLETAFPKEIGLSQFVQL